MKSTSAVAFNISQTASPDDFIVAAYNNGYAKNKNRPICSHCGIAGHTIQRCYKLHGYPQGYKSQNNYRGHAQSSKPTQNWPPRKENVANLIVQDSGGISMHDQQGVCLGTVTSAQVHQLLNGLNATSLNDKFPQIAGSTICLSDGTASTPKPQPHLIAQTYSDTPPSGTSDSSHFISAGIENGLTFINAAWIIDTGASCHVCADLALFQNTKTISDTFVILPDGSRIPVTVSGTIIVSSKLTLFDVLYIPTFKFHLLSISALTRNSNMAVLFSSDSCYIFPENPF